MKMETIQGEWREGGNYTFSQQDRSWDVAELLGSGQTARVKRR